MRVPGPYVTTRDCPAKHYDMRVPGQVTYGEPGVCSVVGGQDDGADADKVENPGEVHEHDRREVVHDHLREVLQTNTKK